MTPSSPSLSVSGTAAVPPTTVGVPVPAIVPFPAREHKNPPSSGIVAVSSALTAVALRSDPTASATATDALDGFASVVLTLQVTEPEGVIDMPAFTSRSPTLVMPGSGPTKDM